MPSYETLDAIADSYNPALLALSVACLVHSLFRARWQLSLARFHALAVIAFFVYGLMFLDRRLDIWDSAGLDYSTHTALALSLVLFLYFCARRWAPLWIGSLVCYVILMLYQRYHSLADVLTTAIAVGVPVGAILFWTFSYAPAQPEKS